MPLVKRELDISRNGNLEGPLRSEGKVIKFVPALKVWENPNFLETLKSYNPVSPVHIEICNSDRCSRIPFNEVDQLIHKALEDARGEVRYNAKGCIGGCLDQVRAPGTSIKPRFITEKTSIKISFIEAKDPDFMTEVKIVGLNNEDMEEVLKQIKKWSEEMNERN